jgi:ribosomal protein L40E
MSKYYRDYIWKEGIPYGIEAIESSEAIAYKIAMDPYRKRIAIEKYVSGNFACMIYDSAFLDFRHLKPAEQTAWQKIILAETEKETIAAIYNQDDRLILTENYHFENQLCRRCISRSGHGIAVCHQEMYYTSLGDPFNGVILFDTNAHPVVFKSYAIDEVSGEFGELIQEVWDGTQINFFSPLTRV